MTHVGNVNLATASTATWGTTAETLVEATLHASTKAAASSSSATASGADEARLGLTVLFKI